MGHSYKGGSVTTPAGPPPSAPTFTVDGDDIATWVWAGANPDQWGFYVSTDVTPGHEEQVYTGSLRTGDLSAIAGETLVLRGVNTARTLFQTPPSPAVFVP